MNGAVGLVRMVASSVSARWMSVIIILVCLLMLAARSAGTDLLNCDMECGETLLSLRAAAQFAAHGIDHGLIENYIADGKSLLYTHNVNIGELSFVLLQAIGVPDPYKLLLPLVIHGFGLLYVFLSVRRVTGSETAALVVLTVFATTYWGLGAFALNPLRSWHLLAFFATVFHSYGLAAESRPSRWDTVGLFLGAAAAFGCGYDFWLICGAVAGCVALANTSKWSAARIVNIAVITTGAFALPFILRQIHVAAVVGLDFWAHDFLYSVAIKMPYADRLIRIPSLKEIDAYYELHDVYRAPAQPGNPAWLIAYTFRHMITSITIPRWGLISLVVLAASIIASLSTAKTWFGMFSRRLVAPVTVGAAAGLVVLAPFSLHVYFKHEFPLFAFPVLLAEGGLLFALGRQVVQDRSALSSVAIMLLVVDIVMVHWNNSTHGPAQNYGWTWIYRAYPRDNVAAAIYELYEEADPFFGIDESRTRRVAPDEVNQARESFFVYQPSDRFVDFDSPRPHCEWRWWPQALIEHPPTPSNVSCIYGSPLNPDTHSQPSLSEFVAQAKGYTVLDSSQRGIGYVLLERRKYGGGISE
jgi:hypothetical protein